MSPPKPLPTDIKSGPGRKRELSRHTPICVPCQRNYRCEMNGIWVRLGPDAIVDADLYRCPGCGHQIVKGFAARYRSRYEPDEDDRRIFAREDELMGAATITGYGGGAVTPGQPDTIPAEDAPEAAAGDGHRYG